MQTKMMTITQMDEAGKGLAVLADMNAVDHDDDGYEAGAFTWKEGGSQWCPLLVAHYRGEMPFGKARVYEDGGKAMAELHLNLDTQVGRDWHAALKFDLANGVPVQEWSYGYDAIQADFDMRGGKQVRILKRIDVSEVSAVVRGAGIGTRTLGMKSAIKGAALKAGHFDAVMAELGTIADAASADPAALSATGRKQLADIHVALGKVLIAPEAAGEKDRQAIAELEAIHSRRLHAMVRANLPQPA